MTLHLPRSKTNQSRKGDVLVIARTGNATCPGAMLELYMRRAHTSWNDKRFLFRPICKAKMGERLRESGSTSYSCSRDLFKKKLETSGEDPGEYGLHSLRAGGASTQLIWGLRTTSASAMVVGGPKMLWTVMWMILWSSGWRSQGT